MSVTNEYDGWILHRLTPAAIWCVWDFFFFQIEIPWMAWKVFVESHFQIIFGKRNQKANRSWLFISYNQNGQAHKGTLLLRFIYVDRMGQGNGMNGHWLVQWTGIIWLTIRILSINDMLTIWPNFIQNLEFGH